MSDQQTSDILYRLIGWSLDHPLTPTSRYLLAAVLVLVVGLFRTLAVTALIGAVSLMRTRLHTMHVGL